MKKSDVKTMVYLLFYYFQWSFILKKVSFFTLCVSYFCFFSACRKFIRKIDLGVGPMLEMTQTHKSIFLISVKYGVIFDKNSVKKYFFVKKISIKVS